MDERKTLEMFLEKTKEAERSVSDVAQLWRLKLLIGELRRESFLEIERLRGRDFTPYKRCMYGILNECKSESPEEPNIVDLAARLYRIREDIESTIQNI